MEYNLTQYELRPGSAVPDHAILKALTFVLKRTVQQGELDEGESDSDEVLVADAEGWVRVDDVVGPSGKRTNLHQS